MNRRDVLTESASTARRCVTDRTGVLFDIGLDALAGDLWRQNLRPEAIAKLRQPCWKVVFEPGNPGDGLILRPIRTVFISRIVGSRSISRFRRRPARVRRAAYPRAAQLLRSSVAIPPPSRCRTVGAVRHFYPRHRPDAWESFGVSTTNCIRRSVVDGMHGLPEAHAQDGFTRAVSEGQPPFAPETVSDRADRAGIRIALRQIKASGSSSRSLPAVAGSVRSPWITEISATKRWNGAARR